MPYMNDENKINAHRVGHLVHPSVRIIKRIAGWIWMKYGMVVIPLRTTLKPEFFDF